MALTSPFHTRMMEIHMKLHNLKQHDDSIFAYLQHAKSQCDTLAAASHPLSLVDFNLTFFVGYVQNSKIWSPF